MFVYCFLSALLCFVVVMQYIVAFVAAASSTWVFGFGFWLSLFASLVVGAVLVPLLLHLAFIIIVNRVGLTLSRFPLPVVSLLH